MLDVSFSQKRCNKCGETKPLEAFAIRADSRDGHRARCKTCEATLARERYAADPETARDKKRSLRAANPGRDREYDRARRAANPEKFRTQRQVWRAANPEKVSAQNRRYRTKNLAKVKGIQQDWYFNNVDHVRSVQRVYRKNNPEIVRAKVHRRRASLKGGGGSYTPAQAEALYEAQNGRCAYCERLIKLTIDHIVPVDRGGSSDIGNICWACRRCNSSKQNKTLDEWTDRWYLRAK